MKWQFKIYIAFLTVIILSLPSVAAAKKYGLIIGIGHYQDPSINTLKYTGADAKAVYDYIIDPKIGQFSPDDVTMLIDDQATRKNILSAFVKIQDEAQKEDMVFIFYAGHGAPELDRVYDNPDGYTKYVVPYDGNPTSLFTTAIATNDLENIFAKIKAECIVFVMDSCYSGGLGGRTFARKIQGRDLIVTDPSANLANRKFGKGRVVITAARANQVAQEKDGHGVFTAAFLDALSGKADRSGDKAVSLDELYNYVYDKVTRETKNKQEPQKAGDITGEIILASAQQGFVFEPGKGADFQISRRWMAPKWTCLALSAGGIAASAGLYVTALNYQGKWKDLYDKQDPDANRVKQDTLDYYTYTYVAIGFTAVAAGLTVTFFVLDEKDKKNAAWLNNPIPTFYVSREGLPGPGVYIPLR